ncbi:hypothetical protein ATANTOWER_013885, partial [Ataeniobius toweri]|nr:hypothetical protein [Ataeniobius toweri]
KDQTTASRAELNSRQWQVAVHAGSVTATLDYSRFSACDAQVVGFKFTSQPCLQQYGGHTSQQRAIPVKEASTY